MLSISIPTRNLGLEGGRDRDRGGTVVSGPAAKASGFLSAAVAEALASSSNAVETRKPSNGFY